MQIDIYCKPAGVEVRKVFTKTGQSHYLYDPNRPIGENTIASFGKGLAKAAGVEDWMAVKNHGVRASKMTELANDPNVSAVEVKNATRHRTLSAQQHYVYSNHLSQWNLSRALGHSTGELMGTGVIPAGVGVSNGSQKIYAYPKLPDGTTADPAKRTSENDTHSGDMTPVIYLDVLPEASGGGRCEPGNESAEESTEDDAMDVDSTVCSVHYPKKKSQRSWW